MSRAMFYVSTHVMYIVLVFAYACMYACVPAYTCMGMYIFVCVCFVLTCMYMCTSVTIFALCIYMSFPYAFVFFSVILHLCKGCMCIHYECSVCVHDC